MRLLLLGLAFVCVLAIGCQSSPPVSQQSAATTAPLAPFPETSLVVGSAMQHHDGALYLIVQASPELVQAGDPELAIARICIEFDPQLRTSLVSSRDGNDPSTPDEYVWLGNYTFAVDGTRTTITLSVNGLTKSLAVADSTFDLRHGNFFRIHVSSNLSLACEQLPVIDLNNPLDPEHTVAVFRSSAAQ